MRWVNSFGKLQQTPRIHKHHKDVATRSRCGPDRHQATSTIPCCLNVHLPRLPDGEVLRGKCVVELLQPFHSVHQSPGDLASRASFGQLMDVLRDEVQVSVQEQDHLHVLAVRGAPEGRHHTPSALKSRSSTAADAGAPKITPAQLRWRRQWLELLRTRQLRRQVAYHHHCHLLLRFWQLECMLTCTARGSCSCRDGELVWLCAGPLIFAAANAPGSTAFSRLQIHLAQRPYVCITYESFCGSPPNFSLTTPLVSKQASGRISRNAVSLDTPTSSIDG